MLQDAALGLPAEKIHQFEGVGVLYPTDADKLTAMIDGYLARVQPTQGSPIALVVPHASYYLSGQVAAYGFRQLANYEYDVAVIIANDHFRPLAMPIAVWTTGAWQTPLGIVAVDTDLAQALVNADPRITANEAAFANEHPIEAEVPFLQRVCPNCKIVPVIMGTNYPAEVNALADALIQLLPGRRAIIIASSDLSHFPTYRDAQDIDSTTLSAIAGFSPKVLRTTIIQQMARRKTLTTCACGEGAILTAMQAARGLGANTGTVLYYANSGDLPEARKDSVTGFGAVMFWQSH